MKRSQPIQQARPNEISIVIGDSTPTIACIASSLMNGRIDQYQTELVVMSTRRIPWNANDAFQPSRPKIANGRFTTTTVTIDASATFTAPTTSYRPRCAVSTCSASGSTKIAG